VCGTNGGTLFSGPKLYNLILRNRFDGASGDVEFYKTGLRDSDHIPLSDFYLSNIVTYNASAEYEGQNATFNNTFGDFAAKFVPKRRIDEEDWLIYNVPHEKLLFPSESTGPPKQKISLEIVDLVSMWTNGVCCALAGLVLLLSLGFGSWTVLHRDNPRIRASQPIFLVPLCLGKSYFEPFFHRSRLLI
jgi:hypothetical protein